MSKEILMEYLKGLLEDAENQKTYTEESEYRRQGRVITLEEIIQELEG